MLQEKIIS